MEIKMDYISGMWVAHKNLVLRLAPEQDEKLAKLIETTVSRFRKKLEKGSEQRTADSEDAPASVAPQPKPTPAPAPKQTSEDSEIYQPKGHKGMLRITCPKCKETFYKFTWKRLNEVECNCGNMVQLDDVVPAKFYCPNCEKEYKQLTNSTEAAISSNCGGCHYDMTSTWNAKKHRYEPVEE